VQVVDDLRAGKEVRSTRGPRICTWREAERVLAGFPDDRADEGPAAGPASLVGLEIARDRGWGAPEGAYARDGRTATAGAAGHPESEHAESARRVEESPADVRSEEDPADKGEGAR
jgi:NADH-quinone oxidoreductase subunit E